MVDKEEILFRKRNSYLEITKKKIRKFVFKECKENLKE